MKKLELFFQLETDYDLLSNIERLPEKTSQIISFTFPDSLHQITIQYTEDIILQYTMKKRKLMGTFFLEKQPFQLFHFSEEDFNNNIIKTEPVSVDRLPCTALISNIEKSNYQLDLFQSDSDPDVFSCHWSDGVIDDAWIFYGITYWFNLKKLTATCKTLSEKKQFGLLTESEVQSRPLNYVNKMRPSNAARVISLDRCQYGTQPEWSWSVFIDPDDGGDTCLRVFLNQRGKVLYHHVE